jgi:hypothetical protein
MAKGASPASSEVEVSPMVAIPSRTEVPTAADRPPSEVLRCLKIPLYIEFFLCIEYTHNINTRCIACKQRQMAALLHLQLSAAQGSWPGQGLGVVVVFTQHLAVFEVPIGIDKLTHSH